MAINVGENRANVQPCDACLIFLRLYQTYCYPLYDGHFFRQFMSSNYYCWCYFINICHSNTTTVSFKALVWCKLNYILRSNIHIWSPYSFVNLDVCHFSVTYKTNSSSTNLEDRRICLSLWKTLLKLFCSLSSTFGIYAYWKKKTKCIGSYFSILFCFSILFPNWIPMLRYFFLVYLKMERVDFFYKSILSALDIF